MLRRFSVVITALAVILVGTAIAATPASASVTRCEPGPRLCIFDQTNFLGNMYYFQPIPAPGCYNLGTAPSGINWDNHIKSIRNNSPKPVRFYTGSGCGGSHVTHQLVGSGSTGWEHCLNTWGKWYVSASPCSNPTATSFWIFAT